MAHPVCRIYANAHREYLVLTSAYNDGVGSLICTLSHRRKHIRMQRVPPMMIQCNEHGDETRFVRPSIILRPTGNIIPLADAVHILSIAITKLRKTRNHSDWEPAFFHESAFALALQVLDDACCLHEDLVVMKRLIRKYGRQLPKTSVAFVEKRYMNCKAIIIQRQWRRAIADPSCELCKRRLRREFQLLME